MSNTFDEIIRAALAPGSRAMLAEHLLKRLDGADQAEIDAAWVTIAEPQLQEVQQGKVTLIPAQAAFRELRDQNLSWRVSFIQRQAKHKLFEIVEQNKYSLL